VIVRVDDKIHSTKRCELSTVIITVQYIQQYLRLYKILFIYIYTYTYTCWAFVALDNKLHSSV